MCRFLLWRMDGPCPAERFAQSGPSRCVFQQTDRGSRGVLVMRVSLLALYSWIWLAISDFPGACRPWLHEGMKQDTQGACTHASIHRYEYMCVHISAYFCIHAHMCAYTCVRSCVCRTATRLHECISALGSRLRATPGLITPCLRTTVAHQYHSEGLGWLEEGV